MRRTALVAGALLLLCCSGDDRPAGSSASSSSPPPPSTSPPVTSAPTTTTSVLSPIAGCPDPGELAPPALERPVYVADASVDPASGTVTGSVQVRFTPDIPTDELVFRLWPNAPLQAADGVHEGVGDVTRDDGVALAVDRPDDTTVHVSLPAPLGAGESVTVSMPYSLTVPGPTPDRVAHDGDTMRLGSFLPLLAWEPGVGWATDPPTTVHAETATSPVAKFIITIAVPDGYDVLGSGERRADGRWFADAVRDVAYSIGHFRTVEANVTGTHLVIGVDASVGDDPARYLQLSVDAFRHYQERFGRYPWPTYTAAVLPGFDGGIEFPTHVMHGAGSTDRSIVHEVAHQWFYSLVGNDQGRDPWLDEGLASYAEFVEIGSLARNAATAVPSDAAGRAGEPMTYWDGHESSYYRGVYAQGAVAVASLGTVDEVDCALRQYVARNAFRIATRGDFFNAVSTVFPDAVDRLAPYGLHP